MADKNLLESADMDKAKEAQASMRRAFSMKLMRQQDQAAPAATPAPTPSPMQSNQNKANDLAPQGLVGNKGGYVDPRFKNPFSQ